MEKVMVIVNGEMVVDYAYPCMMAEKALKNLHNLMLEGKYDEAVTAGIEAMADVKLSAGKFYYEKSSISKASRNSVGSRRASRAVLSLPARASETTPSAGALTGCA